MSATTRLQAFADGIVAGPDTPRGCIVAVSRGDGPVVRACTGTARQDGSLELTTDTPFHVASVGKMFTATLVHQLVDDDLVGPHGLDATLPELASLGLVHPALAAGVHPQAHLITLRHLLSHTSGMKDMQVDDATAIAADLGGPAPASIQAHFGKAVHLARTGRGDGAYARRRWTPWDPSTPDDPDAGHLNLFLASGTAAAPVGEVATPTALGRKGSLRLRSCEKSPSAASLRLSSSSARARAPSPEGSILRTMRLYLPWGP